MILRPSHNARIRSRFDDDGRAGGSVSITLVLAFAMFFCRGASARQPDTTLSAAGPIATFSRAGSLSIGPDGRLFVVERDLDQVLVFSADGVLIDRMGGPGFEEGRFDDPTDVDPGIGLVISVADAGNSRVQRFTRDFRFIESVPVDALSLASDGAGEADNPNFRVGASGQERPPGGRPIAVTTSAADDLYVVDARARAVFRWDRDRRRHSVLGRDPGPGELISPIDLVAMSNRLFVADAGCRCVVVFDQFGTFIRKIAADRLPGVEAIDHSGDDLLITTAQRLFVYTIDGRRLREIAVAIDGGLIDAAYADGRYYLLTGNGLYVATDAAPDGQRR